MRACFFFNNFSASVFFLISRTILWRSFGARLRQGLPGRFHYYQRILSIQQIKSIKEELKSASMTGLTVVVNDLKQKVQKYKDSYSNFQRTKQESEQKLTEYQNQLLDVDLKLQLLGEAVESFEEICKYNLISVNRKLKTNNISQKIITVFKLNMFRQVSCHR